MSPRRETASFAGVLGGLILAFLAPCLVGGKVLSPADVLFSTAVFHALNPDDTPPANRLLIDPVLQFQPWLELNRTLLRQGRLPLWNDAAGCGAPLLANAQSAPFDPINLIAYLGTLPDALAVMAAARLWIGGMGMFFLARLWGLGIHGRWFAGLVYPFTGFLVVWLLFPVTAAAVWMPWLFWAGDRLIERPSLRRVAVLALVVGCLFLAGHIQTSAHVLLASGVYVLWRMRSQGLRGLAMWTGGVVLGLAIAAVTIVPLAAYLTRSPVWSARERERPGVLSVGRPRVLDAICTGIPYAFGSQRKGHPNLARALGVHNLNESAGGFAGLTTLLWLAPQAWLIRRSRPRVGFLVGLAAVGFLAAFAIPPVVNVFRALPVLNVTDLRRLTLWVAFSLPLLGGMGLDHIALPWPSHAARWWLSLGLAAVGGLVVMMGLFGETGPWLTARARVHYAKAAATTEGADRDIYQRRADRQVRDTLAFVPRVLGQTAATLGLLMGLAVLGHRRPRLWPWIQPGLGLVTLAELALFGHGMNPAIDRAADRPIPPVIARLQAVVGREGRVMGVGAELPPNVAMRYGLCDPRNYDSVELTRSLAWFAPLYEPSHEAPSSRRTITWQGVVRARDRLATAGVRAVVGASEPPSELRGHAERIGEAWVVWLDAEPLIAADPPAIRLDASSDHGRIAIALDTKEDVHIRVRQTYDSGWKATVDGRPVAIHLDENTFMSVPVSAGRHDVRLWYDPVEVRAACVGSFAALLVVVFALTGFRPIRST